MIIGCCFICLFAVLINKVSLQVTIEAVVGGSVVLPCSSAEPDLKLQEIDVFWKSKNSGIVYNLIKGSASLDKQNQRYKDRVRTFPEEYKRGNFSIKLNNLTHADAGTFICLITPSDEKKTIKLIINESTKLEENHGKVTRLLWWEILLICVFSLLPLLILVYCIYKHRKKNQAPI